MEFECCLQKDLMGNGRSVFEGAVSKLKIYPNGIEELANENCLL